MTELDGKKIALLGYGAENKAVLVYLLDKNVDQITICDKAETLADVPENVATRLGETYLHDLTDFDVIVRSPGLPYLTPELQRAKEAGVVITSQTKLFFDVCPAQVIGITGTKGKSTTTALIANILQKATDRNELPGKVYAAGNIGLAPLTLLDRLTKDDWVALELSSFQLQDLTVSPHIAVVLNVLVDHLDHHKDESEYISAKKNILRYQKPNDFLVISPDLLTRTFYAGESPANTYYYSREATVAQGAYIEKREGEDKVILQLPDALAQVVCPTSVVMLSGAHNLENVTAAVAAAALVGVSIESMREGIESFAGLSHRLQFVAEKHGIFYYDDSKSTTPDATIAAIESFNKKIVLIVGGSSKGAELGELADTIMRSNVCGVVFIGPEGKKIADLCKDPSEPMYLVEGGATMQETVKIATDLAPVGGVVLLSPAAASFHAFKSAEDRGDQFQAAVQAL